MNDAQRALKENFSHLHPIMFKRSMEKATTDGELFDILSAIPDEYPIIWSDEERNWRQTDRLLQGIHQEDGEEE